MFCIDYGDKPILGDEDKAIDIILWSKKKKNSKKIVSKEFECGLTIKLKADMEEPKLYFFWDQDKFKDFCAGEDVILTIYGIDITMKGGNTTLIMQDSSEEGIPLYMYEGYGNCSELALGMVCLSWEGPRFFTEGECQTDIESFKVQATAEVDKAVTLNDKLGEQKYPEVTTRLLEAVRNMSIEYSRKIK